ncbi:hypothetical protein [Nocardia aurantia]|uniref:hypothetical protein n=1 Tax=Nocardia aurantia TaxID=2585199 RepID=UPI0012959B9C|nr:hypothetical protein [Nocardia aurantia]
MAIPISPRALNAAERALLVHILSVEFAGAAELRSQIEQVEVTAIRTSHSVSVDFRVREPLRRATALTNLVPVDAHVLDGAGEYLGEVLVWIEDGALAGLEYAWVTDDMPTRLPEIASIRLRSN